ncbi:hypothetical protein D9757_013985 [Collybiopsis confluens]|uniref:C2 domain-containing protein n=1 Tax=Collybiopsis confluens TaxID=2823264 RepID=A0A8H5CNH3_9AGAR|nr:hypothetical protein D9757_013985 [Collybiopsis confluens]
MSAEEEIGTLVVVVLKAQNLNDKHFFKQDVYAQITLNGVTKKTKIDYKGGQHPMWDEELRFPVMKDLSSKQRQLEASCWAKEHKDDTLLGEAKVDMTPTLKGGEFDEWVPLSIADVQRGEIYLEITYYSKAPAPAQSSKLAPPINIVRRPSKLSPADRLSRPQPRTPPKDQHQPLPGSYPPDPVRKPAPGPGAVPSTLRPGPSAVASTLKQGTAAAAAPRPAPTRISPKQHQQPLPAQTLPTTAAAAVPSILRPGNPQADPHSSTRRSPSSSPPRQTQFGYNPPSDSSVYPNPYDAPRNGAFQHNTNAGGGIPYASPTSNPNAPQHTTHARYTSGDHSIYAGSVTAGSSHHHPYTQRQTSNPSVLDWNNTDSQPIGGSISFPVPNFPGAPSPAPAPAFSSAPNPNYGSGFYTPPYGPTSPPVHDRPSLFAHPTQLSRTPSVPNTSSSAPGVAMEGSGSGSSSSSTLNRIPSAHAHAHRGTTSGEREHSQSQSHSRSHSHGHSPPLPLPPLPPLPTTSSSPPRPRLEPPMDQQQPIRSRTPVDESRLRALRQAEEEAVRRREQEERDLELARRLDLEEAEREERERKERERNAAVNLKRDDKPPSPPPKQKSVSPPPRGPTAYERAEGERKAQEARDAELARKLDLELNI